MTSYTSPGMKKKKKTFFINSLSNAPLINSTRGGLKLEVLAGATALGKQQRTCRCVNTRWQVCHFISGEISNLSFPLESRGSLGDFCGDMRRGRVWCALPSICLQLYMAANASRWNLDYSTCWSIVHGVLFRAILSIQRLRRVSFEF